MRTSAHVPLWYRSRTTQCRYERTSDGGKRRTRCGRWAKHGTPYCPVHQQAQREFTAQEAATVIASFMGLLRWRLA